MIPSSFSLPSCAHLVLLLHTKPFRIYFCLLLLLGHRRFEGVIYFNIRVQKEELNSVKLAEEIGIEEGSYITMVPAQDPTEQPSEPAVMA